MSQLSVSLLPLWATAHLHLPKRPSSASGLVSGLVSSVGTTQSLNWPNCHVCLLPKSTAARARPFSFLGTLSTQIFHRHRVYLADCRDLICSLCSRWKDFESSSLVSPPLGFSFGFIPNSERGPSMESALGASLEHLGLPLWGQGAEVVWIMGAPPLPNVQRSWRPQEQKICP